MYIKSIQVTSYIHIFLFDKSRLTLLLKCSKQFDLPRIHSICMNFVARVLIIMISTLTAGMQIARRQKR